MRLLLMFLFIGVNSVFSQNNNQYLLTRKWYDLKGPVRTYVEYETEITDPSDTLKILEDAKNIEWSKVRTYAFDQRGISVTDTIHSSDSNYSMWHIFNKEGYMIGLEYRKDAKLLVRKAYEYDEYWNFLLETEWQDRDTVNPLRYYEYAYDDGILKSFKILGPDKRVLKHDMYEFEFFEDSTLERTIEADGFYNELVRSPDSSIFYRYWEYNPSGEVKFKRKYTYDSEGRLVQRLEENLQMKGLVTTKKDDFTYEGDGHHFKRFEIDEKKKKLYLKEIHYFNSNGDWILEERYLKKKVFSSKSFQWVYDEKENWILKLAFKDGVPISAEKRVYTYW